MRREFAFALMLALGLQAAPGPARAGVYPVSGPWTYEDALAPGPATDCRYDRRMVFRGERRFDNSGGVPDFRNVSVERIDLSAYRLVDEFLTAQVRGRTSFTLVVLDGDHIRIHLEQNGRTFVLRRCN